MQGETQFFRGNTQGFTLVELLMAITIGILIISAVLSFFWMQRSSADLQQDVAAVQQDLRGISQMLAANIRMAGYNPQHQEELPHAACGMNFAPGFQLNDPVGNVMQFNNQNCNQAENVATDATHIAFVADIDGNGQISGASQPLEQIAYRFVPGSGDLSGRIEQYSLGADPPWQPVAQNIDGVQFLYRLDDGRDVVNPTTAELNNIRAVTVTILARAASPKSGFTNNTVYRPASCDSADPAAPCPEAFHDGNPWNDNFLRQMLKFTVQCRNL